MPALSLEVFRSTSAGPALHSGTLERPPRAPHSTPEQPSCTSLTCPSLLPGSTLVLRGAGSLCFLECGLAESTGEVCAHSGVGGRTWVPFLMPVLPSF